MNSDLILTVADNSVKLARKYAAENNFGRAFSHYLVIFKLKPDWKSLLKDEFSVTLCKYYCQVLVF